MSNKIYFANSRQQALRHLVLVLTETYRFIRPKTADRQLRKLLLTPQKRKPSPIPSKFTSHQIATSFGTLTSYSVGHGPIILFLHGWSSSAEQFYSLMEVAADHGYQAIAFDQYKHGRSDGIESNFPLFLRGIDAVQQDLIGSKELACVVGHSIGGIAALDRFHSVNCPLFLISPVLDFFNELQQRILGAGFSENFLEKMIDSIADDYDFDFRLCKPDQQLQQIRGPLTIVHSVEDKFALYEHSLHAAQNNPHIKLHHTEGLGHMRIVKAEVTKEKLIAFINENAQTQQA